MLILSRSGDDFRNDHFVGHTPICKMIHVRGQYEHLQYPVSTMLSQRIIFHLTGKTPLDHRSTAGTVATTRWIVCYSNISL